MRCPAVVREKKRVVASDGKFILIINILLLQAAWGGGLLMSEKYKALRFDGVHRANSLTWNPHKLLGALLQCSTFHINEKVKHYQIRSGSENLLTAWKSEHVQEILLTTNKVEFKWDFVNLSYYLGTKSIFTSS